MSIIKLKNVASKFLLLLLIFAINQKSCAQNCIENYDSEYCGEYVCTKASIEELERIHPETQNIEIIDTPINRLGPKLLSLYPNLMKISFKSCNISDIEDNTFANNPKLYQVSLSDNNLEKIRTGMFQDAKSLRNLDLNFNKISFIDVDTFSNIPVLHDLRISGNPLQCFNFYGLRDMKIYADHMPNFTCSKDLMLYAKNHNIELYGDESWGSI